MERGRGVGQFPKRGRVLIFRQERKKVTACCVRSLANIRPPRYPQKITIWSRKRLPPLIGLWLFASNWVSRPYSDNPVSQDLVGLAEPSESINGHSL
jgi:hypothetical protein